MEEIKEQPIAFKTAKLAKEKGFITDLEGMAWMGTCYNKNGKLSDDFFDENGKELNTYFKYLAPTQSLLLTWLKKKHGLYAYIDWVNDEVVIADFKHSEGEELFRLGCYDFVPDYESEEELLEGLLQKALKLIK